MLGLLSAASSVLGGGGGGIGQAAPEGPQTSQATTTATVTQTTGAFNVGGSATNWTLLALIAVGAYLLLGRA